MKIKSPPKKKLDYNGQEKGTKSLISRWNGDKKPQTREAHLEFQLHDCFFVLFLFVAFIFFVSVSFFPAGAAPHLNNVYSFKVSMLFYSFIIIVCWLDKLDQVEETYNETNRTQEELKRNQLK